MYVKGDDIFFIKNRIVYLHMFYGKGRSEKKKRRKAFLFPIYYTFICHDTTPVLCKFS